MTVTIETPGAREHILILTVPFSTFAALNTAYNLANYGSNTPYRVTGIDCFKDTPFDAGDIRFGIGTAGAQQQNLMGEAEVAATTEGTSLGANWRGWGTNHVNLLLKNGSSFIVFARCLNALPSLGSLRLRLFVEKLPALP